MWKDPIVQEVRKAGEKIAKQVDYNLHTFFQKLRKNEKKRLSEVTKKIVSKKGLKTPTMPTR